MNLESVVRQVGLSYYQGYEGLYIIIRFFGKKGSFISN